MRKRTGAGRFARTRRLLTAHHFRRCLAEGHRLAGRYFRIHWLAAPGGPRLGLVVSRKVDRRSVGRNRIKRQARESFRLACARLPAADLVLLARPEAAAAGNGALRADLAALWSRLLALKPEQAQGTMPRGSGSTSGPEAGPAAGTPPDTTIERPPRGAALPPPA